MPSFGAFGRSRRQPVGVETKVMTARPSRGDVSGRLENGPVPSSLDRPHHAAAAIELRSATKLDDRQMRLAVDVADDEFKSVYPRMRGPFQRARLEQRSRPGLASEGLLRRAPTERHMWPATVVPDRVGFEFLAECAVRQRNENPPRALVLERRCRSSDLKCPISGHSRGRGASPLEWKRLP